MILLMLQIVHPVGLRERKKVETRRAIAAAALQLALEMGPGSVTVDLIADAAGVSPRTVFNYFGTKDEAILGLSPQSRSETAKLLRARPVEEPPLESLEIVMRERLTAVDETGRYWRDRAELVRRFPELYPAHVASQAALEEELTAVVAERIDVDPTVELYPRLVVATAFAALRVALMMPTGPGSGADCNNGAVGSSLGQNLEAAFNRLRNGLSRASDKRLVVQ